MAEAGGIVALLFTDLVGSTTMYDQLGDARAEEVRRAHFAGLRSALGAHGGREVKSLGDGLMVTFSSAVAAVEAAVAMQRAAASADPGPEARPELRVGLHAGEPLRDEDDYFGVSVNIARRLCDVARPGQIVASDLVRALVSPRLRTGLRPLGALSLKGIEEPVAAFEVEWAPPATSTPLPPLLAVPSDVPLVGRDAELDRLVQLWKATAAGAAMVVLVSGEPGIGKTRLVSELARRVVQDPSLVLAGRSDAEVAAPLEPFAEAFRTAAATWPPEAAAMLAAPALEPLVRATGAATALADTTRSELFGAVLETLHQAQAHRPVLLVLDDLHWADDASISLLRRVLRSAPPRTIIVATYRDTELSRTHPLAALLADLRRERGVERVALRGLGVDAVAALLGEGGVTHADLASRISRETEGNPFFVNEVIRHLVERGRLRPNGGSFEVVGVVDTIDVPEGIREVVGRRLSRLSDSTNEVLKAASVVGREFGARVVAAIAEVPLDVALDALEEALDARLVEERTGVLGTFGFSHALVRETLYAELPTIRRLRLHHRAAEALQASGGTLGEVAHHLLEAGPAAPSRVVGEAALAAVEDARFRLVAFETAASLCRRALPVLTEAEQDLRCDLLTTLGDTTLSAGDAAGLDILDEALALAKELDDPLRMARIATFALRAGGTNTRTGQVEAARQALARMPAEAGGMRSRLRGVLAFSRVEGLADAAGPGLLAEARSSGDREAIVYAALASADAALVANDPAAARAALDSAFLQVNERIDEAALVADERYFEISLLLGDRDEAERAADRLRTRTERLDLPASWGDPMPRAGLAFLDGRLDEVEAQVQRVMSHRAALEFTAATLAAVALERDQVRQTLPLVEAQVTRPGQELWRAPLALFLAEAGRGDEAASCLHGALDALSDPDFGWRVAMGTLAEAASEVGAAGVAAEVASRLGSLRGMTLTYSSLCLGAVERLLGRCALTCGDTGEAVALLEEAVERNEAFRSPLWVAHSSIDLAAALRVRGGPGDSRRAETLVRGAAETAARLGLPRVARRAGAAPLGAAPVVG